MIRAGVRATDVVTRAILLPKIGCTQIRAIPVMPNHTNRPWSSSQARAAALTAVSVVVAYLIYRLLAPFFPALTWALALAVSAYPLHRWLERRIKFKNVAAAVAVSTIAIAVVLPAGLVSRRLAHEANEFRRTVQNEVASGRLRETLERIPQIAPWLPWLETQFGFSSSKSNSLATEDRALEEDSDRPETPMPLANHAATVQQAAGLITAGAGTVIAGLAWLLGQLFITFLALFFFFRDRALIVRFVQKLIPLSDDETNQLIVRIDDTIHATVYGSLAVAVIQGSMGGLMFWYLGLPSPILWGGIMGLLAVVPVLGTFVIWAPTAAYLALQGEWTDALLLAGWGSIAIALVDNFIYPYLVGKRLRYHTLLVFLAIVGGLTLFGASGVILGPLILAIADGLIEAWRAKSRPVQIAA
jgi:predicted PurR-regulated permease PerM